MKSEFGNHRDIFECRRSGVSAEVLRGMIVAASPELLLVRMLENGWFFDGYTIVRVGDITEYRFFNDRDSIENKVRKLMDYTAAPPEFRIDLSSMSGVARSLFAAGKLFSIEKERSCKGVMWLGKIRRLTSNTMLLSELDSEAQWSHDHRHVLSAITKICFDSAYIRFYEKLSEKLASADR